MSANEVLAGYLGENVKITKIKDHSAAGTSPITSDELDMLGYDRVLFLTSLSVANSGDYMTMGPGATGAEAPTVAVVQSGSSEEDLVLDVRPDPNLGRYVNVIVTVGTSSTVDSIWAIQYNSKRKPGTNALSGTLALAQFNGPALA